MAIQEKICRNCKQIKSIAGFNKSSNTNDGYEGKCKTCRQEARKKYTRICVVCGKEFKTAKKHTELCSQKCVGKLRTTRHNTEVNCGLCDKPFTVNLYKAKNTVYCSLECFSKATAIRMTGERSPRLEIKCDNCGETLIKSEQEASRSERHFCDKECFSKGIGKYRRDPNLSDDVRLLRRQYPEYTEWRNLVLARDKYTCQACHKKGREFNVHHILNYSSYPKLRTEVSNGITFCVDCHLEYHLIYGNHNNTKNQLYEYVSIKSWC